MKIITLITDFGLKDEYAGVVKGAILSVARKTEIIDISHSISPQNVNEAALMIESAYSYFPKGTIHCVIVDPGVGSDRAIIAIEGEGYTFLTPDNGIAHYISEKIEFNKIVSITNKKYFRNDKLSRTFHGRDIFAPVAGHISLGVSTLDMGEDIGAEMLCKSILPKPEEIKPGVIKGSVLYVDSFGNLITNIERKYLIEYFNGKNCVVIFKKMVFEISNIYKNKPEGEPLVLVGSRGTLEIAVNSGNAALYFNALPGDELIATKV